MCAFIGNIRDASMRLEILAARGTQAEHVKKAWKRVSDTINSSGLS